MSQARKTTSYGSATKSSLRNRIDEYSEILYEDTFKCEDLDGPRDESQAVISFLKSNQAITSKEKIRIKDDGDSKLVNIWEWINHQAHLQDHWENRDELPKCGHRTHIPPERDGDTFYCKFCGEAYDRETIKEVVQ